MNYNVCIDPIEYAVRQRFFYCMIATRKGRSAILSAILWITVQLGQSDRPFRVFSLLGLNQHEHTTKYKN